MPLVTTERSHAAQLRAANYYTQKLDQIDVAYQSGGENALYALQTFDREWEQMLYWRTWAVEHAENSPDIARAAAAFSRVSMALLERVLTAKERFDWVRVGLECSVMAQDRRFQVEELLTLAGAAHAIYDYEAAQRYATEGLNACNPDRPSNEKAQAYKILGIAQRLQGNLQQAWDFLQTSLAVYRECFNSESVATLAYELSSIAGMMGNFAEVRNLAEQSLLYYRRTAKYRMIGMCLNNLGMADFITGMYPDAETHLLESLDIFEKLHMPSPTTQALTNLASIAHAQARYNQAEQYALRSLEINREIHDDYGIAVNLYQLGQLARSAENFSQAGEYFVEALELHQHMGDRYSMVECLVGLGSTSYYLENDEDAESYLRQGLEYALEVQHRQAAADCYYYLVLLYAEHLKQPEQALVILQQALEIVLELKTGPDQLKLLTAAAHIWHRQGYHEIAAQWLGLAQHHFIDFPDMQGLLQPLRASLMASFEPAQLEILMQSGVSLDIEAQLRLCQAQVAQFLNHQP